MNYFFDDMLRDSISILSESGNPTIRESKEIRMVLEDTESPKTNKYLEILYSDVIKKGHIDFDNIATSKGNIESYVGYTNMINTLNTIRNLATSEKSNDVVKYVDTVIDAINNIKVLAKYYTQAYKLKDEYLMLEYNTMVYTVVQATSSLLYDFIDYIKRPDKDTITISIKNNKYRANLFYIQQLDKYNKINRTMDYRKYLETKLNGGRNNFTGAEVIGMGAVAIVALAIIPVTRELIYKFYDVKSNLSDALAQQAYFLEMNKAAVEANGQFSENKKKTVLAKQEKIKLLLLRISEKLRVNHIKSEGTGKSELAKDNKLLTLDNIKKEVDNSGFELL